MSVAFKLRIFKIERLMTERRGGPGVGRTVPAARRELILAPRAILRNVPRAERDFRGQFSDRLQIFRRRALELQFVDAEVRRTCVHRRTVVFGGDRNERIIVRRSARSGRFGRAGKIARFAGNGVGHGRLIGGEPNGSVALRLIPIGGRKIFRLLDGSLRSRFLFIGNPFQTAVGVRRGGRAIWLAVGRGVTGVVIGVGGL